MNKYSMWADLGEPEPVLLVSAPGALLFFGMAAYDNGSAKAEAIVDRALAVAAEKGYAGAPEFRAAFRRRPRDMARRQAQVDAVFAVLDPWEFLHRVMVPALAAQSGEAPGKKNPAPAPKGRILH